VLKHIPYDAKKEDDKYNNLFIRGLPQGFTDEKLKEAFAGFVSKGQELQSVKVAKTKDEELLDYGYITFSSCEDAMKAVNEMNKKKMGDNSVLLVQKWLSKKEVEIQMKQKHSYLKKETNSQNGNTLVVKGNLNDVTEAEMLELFSQIGPVLSAKISKKECTNQNTQEKYFRTTGYLMMEQQKDAQKVIQQYDQERCLGTKLSIEFWQQPSELKQETEKQKMDGQVKVIKQMQRNLQPQQ
jgi:RNA recognition motif-containing protein